MGDPVTLALIGAGIGGGTSLLKGQGLGSSLQNAAIGGALGGVGGQFLPSAFGATPAAATSAGSQAAQAAGGAMMTPTDLIGANAPSLLTGAAPYATPIESMMPLIAQSPVSGGLAATQAAAPSFFDGMSDYLTPQNLMGVSNLMQQDSAAPQMSSVGGGGVRGGNAQTGEGVEEFLRRMGARVQSPQRRQGLFY
jgi:hypothetical protein